MKKMGRPKGDNNKEKICTIRIDEGTLRRLEAYCKLMNVAKSEAIRDAIEKMIEKVPSDN
ncbi:MAG: ribbon-helix-helix protein, CopG family [Aeriscardovia sp.]|nr:ribbon-helix-helix protein, CopG family [Aeriscardovia sp.]